MTRMTTRKANAYISDPIGSRCAHVFYGTAVFKTFQNSQENACTGVLF